MGGEGDVVTLALAPTASLARRLALPIGSHRVASAAVTTSQKALAAFFSFTGTMHFVIPKQYEATVPGYVPISPEAAVFHSGWAEIAGGLAVIPPRRANLRAGG